MNFINARFSEKLYKIYKLKKSSGMAFKITFGTSKHSD